MMTVIDVLEVVKILNKELPQEVVARGDGYQFRSDGTNFGVFVMDKFCVLNSLSDEMSRESLELEISKRSLITIEKIAHTYFPPE